MTIDDVVAIANQTLFVIIKVSAPILIVSLVVGLIISIFQTVTSIQEQTLTFVPKILAIFVTIMLFGHWILVTVSDFVVTLWSDFNVYVK